MKNDKEMQLLQFVLKVANRTWYLEALRATASPGLSRCKQYHMNKLFSIAAFFISTISFDQTDSVSNIKKAYEY